MVANTNEYGGETNGITQGRYNKNDPKPLDERRDSFQLTMPNGYIVSLTSDWHEPSHGLPYQKHDLVTFDPNWKPVPLVKGQGGYNDSDVGYEYNHDATIVDFLDALDRARKL